MGRNFSYTLAAVAGCGVMLAAGLTPAFARCWSVSGFTFCDDRERYSGHEGGGGGVEHDDEYWERQRRAAEARQAQLAAEAERKRKAEVANDAGINAAARGDWAAAATFFDEALNYAPESADIRARRDNAREQLADIGSARHITSLHDTMEDRINSSKIETTREEMEDSISADKIGAMSAAFEASIRQDRSRKKIVVKKIAAVKKAAAVKKLSYPALRRPVPADSPAALVLDESQQRIRAIDRQIRQAQIALRRLIRSNLQSEEQRVEWVKVSEEATVESEALSLNLVIDLLGAHVDHLSEINDQERLEVLGKLIGGVEGDRRSGVHTAFGALLNRQDELKRLKDELRLAGKESDLKERIADLRHNKNSEFRLEDLWDVLNQFKKVEEMVGPSKDLLDTAYTIYKQASAFETLSSIRGNQERTLQAAEVLRRHIIKLEEQKKSAKARVSR